MVIMEELSISILNTDFFFFLKQSIFHIKENLIDQDRENILEIPRMNDTDRRAKHFNYK